MSTRQDSFCSNAAEEFCRTEQTYLASLEVLIECYLKPVMSAAKDPARKKRLEDFVGLVVRIKFCHKILDSKVQTELAEQQAAVKELHRMSLLTPHSCSVSPRSPTVRSSSAQSDDTGSDGTNSNGGGGTASVMIHNYGSLVLSNSSDFKAFGRMLTDFPKLLLEMSGSFKDPYSEYIMHHEEHVALMEDSVKELSSRGCCDREGQNADADVNTEKRKSATGAGGGGGGVLTSVEEEANYVCFEQQTQQLVEAQRRTQEALAENGGVDLSLAALLNAPLKRLTNYSLLTQEWISGMERKQQEVPPTTIKAQQSISGILKSVERCITLVRSAERLKVLEQQYKIPGLASRESEIIVEAHMTRGTRTTPTGKDWKTRPCYLLVCNSSMYIIKLHQYGEGGEPRGDALVIPLHRMEQMLLKPKAKDITQFFGDKNVGMHIKFRNPSSSQHNSRSNRGSISTTVRTESPARGSSSVVIEDKERGAGARRSTLITADGVHPLAAKDNVTKELFLLNEDKLLVQGWDQKVKFAVNSAIANWMVKEGCTLDATEE